MHIQIVFGNKVGIFFEMWGEIKELLGLLVDVFLISSCIKWVSLPNQPLIIASFAKKGFAKIHKITTCLVIVLC